MIEILFPGKMTVLTGHGRGALSSVVQVHASQKLAQSTVQADLNELDHVHS